MYYYYEFYEISHRCFNPQETSGARERENAYFFSRERCDDPKAKAMAIKCAEKRQTMDNK